MTIKNDYHLAMDPESTPQELFLLYEKDHPHTQVYTDKMVANNPTTMDYTLFRMAVNGQETRYALAKRESYSSDDDIFAVMLADRTLTTLANNQLLKEDHMMYMVEQTIIIQRRISRNPVATSDVLEKLLVSNDTPTLLNILHHPNAHLRIRNEAYDRLPQDEKDKFDSGEWEAPVVDDDDGPYLPDRDTDSENEAFQLKVLDLGKVSTRLLGILAESPYDAVRRKLVNRPNIPSPVLTTLSKDKLSDVAEKASELLTKQV